ncbi:MULTISPECIES: LysE family translocator [unclassified Pseudomonas]|uniref:LysE family translocator n=1 Tax=unclassified Pseudomonas TaxID=196821 RepID=UPI000D331BA0|nr:MULTISPECIES: LysE family translocator [unclassified Pseudomonas]RAU47574.1 LysE family translocator [Pseudomonas sp. RIT 409]RAU49034.1 LysE family translocator [Pseudomonas sp. RIT 412]
METFLPFVLFAFVASITPGPTNILVLTNSSRHGLLRTLPLMLGGCAGAALMVLIVGTGLGDLLAHHRQVQRVMTWVGIAWLTWLAWQIFSAPAEAVDPDTAARGPRLGLWSAASLQLVNPKTWMMALAVVSVFAGSDADRLWRIVWLSLVFFLVAIPCMSAWAYLGVSAAKFCRSARSMKRFNQVMALPLLASAWLTLVM